MITICDHLASVYNIKTVLSIDFQPSKQLKRYLFVSHGSSLHGAELCLLETIIAFKDSENCEIMVIVPNQKEGELGYLLNMNGAIVISGIDNPWWVDQKFSLGSFSWRTFKTIAKTLRLLIQYKPDYVIINSIVVSPAFAIASRICRLKTIWYIHELGDLDHGWKYLLGKLYTFKIIQCLSNRQVFNSFFTANYFGVKQNINISRYAITTGIPSISSISPLRNVKSTNNWHIVLIGRTAEGKGQSQIIEAANLLRQNHHINNFKISIIGVTDCEYSKYLSSLVKKYILSDYIELIPFGNHVHRYLKKADIGVTTSHNESFGRITVEYLKAGLVTIGAACGGTKEILQEFEGVYQYKLENIEDLSNKLQLVFNGDKEEMSRQCKINAIHARNIYNKKNLYRSLSLLLESM
jgi:glycosyltransferase involved in cell wall biosynthesis